MTRVFLVDEIKAQTSNDIRLRVATNTQQSCYTVGLEYATARYVVPKQLLHSSLVVQR